MFEHQSLHDYLLSMPATTMDNPFGPDVMVFRVKNKMFATLAAAADKTPVYWLNLKCDPDEAEMLRSIFPAIIPGYHMCKRTWNTIILDGSVPVGEIERLADNSYELVVNKMTKKDQQWVRLQSSN
jgi:predicted DNA-binding protein (MmcQ/YjbR family)